MDKCENGCRRYSRIGKALILLMLSVAITAACTLTLISSYDEQIDKTATELQKKMDHFLTSLQADLQPAYQESKAFYDDYLIELRSVLVRAKSHPKNSITEKQIELMMGNIEELRAMHKEGALDTEAIDTTRDLFNTGWRAVITLELAKKRGG